MELGDYTALIAAASLLAIAALHVYWAFGGYWPGHDARSLVVTVVGEPPETPVPSTMACLAVAVLLLIAATLPLAARGWIGAPGPRWILPLALWGLVAVLGLRGLGGYLERRFRPVIVGLPYDRLNRWVYSPLCLLLAALVASAGIA